MNPKALVFYMAFFPLFIDAESHPGFVTFAAMAATIAVITLAYCLALCAGASAISQRLRSHRWLALTLQRVAGVALIGFGLRLAR
jgi:threonine/homoserine/homoserine lactone efflux protein